MLNEFAQKFLELKNHHQVLFGFIIFLSAGLFWWAIEGICDEILFKERNKKVGYFIVILISLVALYFTNYFVSYNNTSVM